MVTEVFKGSYVTVTLDKRDGRTYERVYVRDGVSVIPITSDGRIRLIREKNWDTGAIRIKLVSGYVNVGEAPQSCATRELEEELGLRSDLMHLFMEAPSEEATIKKTQYYFLARMLRQGTPHPDEDEEIEGYVDLSFEQVHDMIQRGDFGVGSTAFVLQKFISAL